MTIKINDHDRYNGNGAIPLILSKHSLTHDVYINIQTSHSDYLANMDNEGAKGIGKKMYHRDPTSMIGAWLRILVLVLIFLWTMRSGFELATEPRKFAAFAAWSFQIGTSMAFHIGVVTMLFGFLALILGLPILADLGLNLLDQLQDDSVVSKGKFYLVMVISVCLIFLVPVYS